MITQLGYTLYNVSQKNSQQNISVMTTHWHCSCVQHGLEIVIRKMWHLPVQYATPCKTIMITQLGYTLYNVSQKNSQQNISIMTTHWHCSCVQHELEIVIRKMWHLPVQYATITWLQLYDIFIPLKW